MTCPLPGTPCLRCGKPLSAYSPGGSGDAACDACQLIWDEEPCTIHADQAEMDGLTLPIWEGTIWAPRPVEPLVILRSLPSYEEEPEA